MIGDNIIWKELSDEEIIQTLKREINILNTGLNECHKRNIRMEISLTHFNEPLNATKAIMVLRAWKDFSLG